MLACYNSFCASVMLYDVLCLKSILGFLVSERTSGVSSVIFILWNSIMILLYIATWAFQCLLKKYQRFLKAVLFLFCLTSILFRKKLNSWSVYKTLNIWLNAAKRGHHPKSRSFFFVSQWSR